MLDCEIVGIFYILAGFIFSTGIGNDCPNSDAFETGGGFFYDLLKAVSFIIFENNHLSASRF